MNGIYTYVFKHNNTSFVIRYRLTRMLISYQHTDTHRHCELFNKEKRYKLCCICPDAFFIETDMSYEGTSTGAPLRFRLFMYHSIGDLEYVKSLKGFRPTAFRSEVMTVLLIFGPMSGDFRKK